MAKEKSHTVLTVRVPVDLMEKARTKSEETGVPISFVVRKAIEAWVSDDVKEQKKR